MVNVHTASTALFEFIRDAGITVARQLSKFEALLRDQLLTFGIPPHGQTLILISIVALLAVVAARLLVGPLRIATLIVLALIAIHLVFALAHG